MERTLSRERERERESERERENNCSVDGELEPRRILLLLVGYPHRAVVLLVFACD